MKNKKNLLFITLPTIVILIAIAEIILRQWFWVPDPYEKFKSPTYNVFIPSEFDPNLRLLLKSLESLSGLDSTMHFSTNNVGFRGDSLIRPKPLNELRIFIVGGSTAACFYIDDSKSLDKVLQTELQSRFANNSIKVYNAGKPGDATSEHIAMLSHRIIHLEPDLVIVFAGINDLLRSAQGYDYAHFSKTKAQGSYSGLFKHATNFQIPRRIYYSLKTKTIQEKREEIAFTTDYKKNIEIQNSIPVSDSFPQIKAGPYQQNLNSIAGICKMNSVPLIFMTNQSTWNSKVDPAAKKYFWMLLGGKVHYKEEYMDKGLDSFNNVMRNASIAHNIALFDLADSIPKSLQYFYDDCHFNVAGADYTGKKLALFIRDRNVFQTK